MNTRKFFSLFLSLIFIAGLTSCSDEDKDDPAELLIGTWSQTNLSMGYIENGKPVEISNEAYAYDGSLTFKSNGELIMIDFEGKPQVASYVYSKGKLFIYNIKWEWEGVEIEGDNGAFEVTELTRNKLVLEYSEVDEEGEISYMKAIYKKN